MHAHADATHVYRDASAFAGLVGTPTVASFNALPAGFLPQTSVMLGGVRIDLTNSGSFPVFEPGEIPLIDFTTRFLSTGVQDGDNNVVITVPGGTGFVTLNLLSYLPVTVAFTLGSGAVETVTFQSTRVAFLGAIGDPQVRTVRISSPTDPRSTPIVNVGDIGYGSSVVYGDASAAPSSGIPTVSPVALGALAVVLAMLAFVAIRRGRAPDPPGRR